MFAPIHSTVTSGRVLLIIFKKRCRPGGRVTIRGSGVGGVSSSNALAFGKLLHHGEFARPAEFACESPEMAMVRRAAAVP